MWLRLILSLSLAMGLGGCGQAPQEGYAAVLQILADPHVAHLIDGYYLAKDREGDWYLIDVDDYGEPTILYSL